MDENKLANNISDGFHTIEELYEHRFALYIALCNQLKSGAWRSKTHSDGSSFEGWFLMGINKEKGKQISYHLPDVLWNQTNFAETLDKAPDWDGHTSKDVLKRLAEI